MVIIIALLHCLPPIIGSFFGKSGLKIGIAIGVIAAFIFGALVFTVFDLMGVGLGALIGLSLLGRDRASDKPIKKTHLKKLQIPLTEASTRPPIFLAN